jgi:alcohol dehydrogenase
VVTRLAERSIEIVLRNPVSFGVGAVHRLPEVAAKAGGSRIFLVTDPGVRGSAAFASVVEVLTAAGLETGTFGDVEPNPGTATVERGAAALRAFGIEGTVVVPVGGGSSIDTAKALDLCAANEAPVLELGYDDPSLKVGRPIVAIPTTAGTGAETNSYGVITNESAGRKMYVGHPSLLPAATILDPALTVGLPPSTTAATGIDALTHALESLLSANPNPFAEAIALGVVRTVGEWLPRAVADGSDLEARSQMLVASHMAGVGQASGTGVGLVHALGHALGTRGRLAHGTALATVLPEVLAFYVGARDRELALVANALGVAAPIDPDVEAAQAGVDAIRRLIEAVGQRRTLRQLGLGRDSIAQLVSDARDDPAIRNSPRLATAAEATAILEAVAG